MTNPTRLSILDRVRATTGGESWNEFSNIYGDMILGWLRSQGVQAQDADDIRQDVMTIVLREIGRFQHNGRTGAFRRWLRTVTSNSLRAFWRKGKYRNAGANLELMAGELEDEQSRQTLVWNAEHDRVVLAHLLRQLSSRFNERSVVAFRRIVIEQEPAADVAADLGMTLGAARVAQHRVLQALKELGKELID